MKIIAVVGDIHGDINGMYAFLKEWEKRSDTKIDAVLQIGDFGVYYINKYVSSDWRQYWNKERIAPYPTYVVPGNHEGWNELVDWMNEPDRVQNIHLLADGGITEVEGFKIGSIWGNFSPNSWANPKIIDQVRRYDSLSVKANHIYRPSVERLQALGAFDILLTHDAPYGMMQGKQPPVGIKRQLGLAGNEIATGCPAFNELYESAKPIYHFFGHFHTYKVCKDHNPCIICLHCFNYNKADSVWFIEK